MPREYPQNLCVDGIPVGDGYGVERDEVPSLTAYLFTGRFGAPVLEGPPRVDWWLIRWTGADWERVRRLPPDATISFDHRGRRYVYLPERTGGRTRGDARHAN